MKQKGRNKNFVYLFVFIVLLILGDIQSPCYAQNNIWKAGTARIDITPKDTLWLAGYASRDHGAEGTLHKIWVKALAIEDQKGNRGVLVTSDLLGFPKNISDNIRNQCYEKYGLSKAQIILSSSHTHSGPVLRNSINHIYPLTKKRIELIEQYSDNLEKKIVTLVGQAFKNMIQAQLFSGNGVVRFQINRRNNNAATLTMQSNLKGPNDYAVPVLQARKTNGDLLSIAFGYACHATVLNICKWSGDYPGFAQLALEEKYPGANAMFFQGCGADQNPLPRRSIALAEQYGEELAAAVKRVISEKGESQPAELKMAYSEIELEFTSPPSKETLQKMADDNSVSYRRKWAKQMLDKIEKGIPFPKSYPYPLQVWKVGNQAIFVLGGETAIDYTIALKRIFGENIFVLSYSNDVMNYIPSTRILREGGYEGTGAPVVYGLPATWQADIENRIIHEAIKLAKKIDVKMPEAKIVPE